MFQRVVRMSVLSWAVVSFTPLAGCGGAGNAGAPSPRQAYTVVVQQTAPTTITGYLAIYYDGDTDPDGQYWLVDEQDPRVRTRLIVNDATARAAGGLHNLRGRHLT